VTLPPFTSLVELTEPLDAAGVRFALAHNLGRCAI
jgi:hypothetical protein